MMLFADLLVSGVLDALVDVVPHLLRSSGSGSSQFLWLAPVVTGPAAGGGTYYVVHNRYRNPGETYRYEDVSRIELRNEQHGDVYVRERSKTRERHVEAWEQSRDPRVRVHGKPQGLGGFFGLFD